MLSAGLESLIYEKRGEEKEAEEKVGQGLQRSPGTTPQRTGLPGSKEAWRRLSAGEAEGRPGRLSNSPQDGGAVTASEAPEEPATRGVVEAADGPDILPDLEPAPPEGEATAGGGGP